MVPDVILQAENFDHLLHYKRREKFLDKKNVLLQEE
jgi:hypothetical protein